MADFDSAAADEEAKQASTVRNVTVKTFFKNVACSDYVLSETRAGNEVIGTTTIGWCFPDGTASLDRVEIDGVIFEGEVLNTLPIKDAGLKEGSTIQVYKTALEDDDEEEGS